ncbi:MAG: T9SS type A sorting domain-containing protein [Bacteroidales bacterium]|nr:T9SS type A sorting domain-containing protein [Bacteroidales bacterium]
MKKLTIISIIILLANTLSAQWIQQNTNYPENRSLLEIFFIDENQGWVVGEDDTFSSSYGTYNGGEDWETCFLFGTFHSVFFTDENNGWAVGNDGIIWHTNNGGIGFTGVWEEQQSNSNLHLVSVYFTDSLNGWIGASTLSCNTIYQIHHTTDGGENWEEQHNGSGNLLDIFFIDSLNGWVVGGQNILQTVDGGENWTNINIGIDHGQLNAIYFADQMNGWIVGEGEPPYGIILNTNNGGESWKQQTSLSVPYLNDIAFADSLNGWAVGTEGAIINTSNGGDNWEFQESGTSIDLYSISLADKENAWICGRKSIILHTNNGGFVGITESSKIKSSFKVFPNPIYNEAIIEFDLSKTSDVYLSVYNFYGQVVKLIYKGQKNKGNHKINWGSRDLPKGTYFIKLQTDAGIFTQKVLIISELP